MTHPDPKKSGHTPGPWQVLLEPYPHIRSQSHGCILARDYEPKEADARLIAAAPELLAMLQDVAEGHALHSDILDLLAKIDGAA